MSCGGGFFYVGPTDQESCELVEHFGAVDHVAREHEGENAPVYCSAFLWPLVQHGSLLGRAHYRYQEHIREFAAISDELDVYSLKPSDVDDTSCQGLVVILVWGIVFWTAAWIALLLIKYSEGTGCVSRLRFLIVKQLKRLGIDSLLGHCGPKAKDVEDKPTYHRKPTLTFGVSQPEPEKVA